MKQNGQAVDVVIMAAGKGTRMKSRLPKVLHRLAGRALLQHVVDTASGLNARRVVVITGHGAAEVEAGVARPAGGELQFVRQEPQLGTGHAVQQAVPALPDDGIVVVLSGDVPLTQADTLRDADRRLRRRQAGLADHRVCRPDGLWPHRARRRRCGAGHRRAQGRQRGAAPDQGDLQRHHGRAGGAAQALAGPAGQQERPGRVLPDRRGEVRRGRGRAGGGAQDCGCAAGGRRQQPGAAGRAGARAPAARGHRR